MSRNESVQNIPYRFEGPFMDTSMRSVQLPAERMGLVSGADGRYVGGIVKMFGMRFVGELRSAVVVGGGILLGEMCGISYFKHMCVQKGTSPVVLTGFVVRFRQMMGGPCRLGFFFMEDGGWRYVDFLGTDARLTEDVAVGAVATGRYLLFTADGIGSRTVFFHNGVWRNVEMGPGRYALTSPDGSDSLRRMTSLGTRRDEDFALVTGGRYVWGYRFFDSARGVHSAMSQLTTLTMTRTEGGVAIEDGAQILGIPRPNIQGMVVEWGNVPFDTVEIWRSIDTQATGSVASGAILYLERTRGLAGLPTEGWGGKRVEGGVLADNALVMQEIYDGSADLMRSPPIAGTIGTYQGVTFMGETPSVRAGVDTVFTNVYKESPEYFTADGRFRGSPEDGRPLRFIEAGDTLYIISANSLIRCQKRGADTPMVFRRLHIGRGTVCPDSAHSVGNSLLMLSSPGLVMVQGDNADMTVVSAAARLVSDRWANSLRGVTGCFSGRLNCSFMLNPERKEAMVLWHGTRCVTLLEGMTFVGCSSGVDPNEGQFHESYFVSDTGRIVSPDAERQASGTMWGWPVNCGFTLNGTCTGGTRTDEVVDGTGTFDGSMVGAMVFMASGANAGEGRVITEVQGHRLVVQEGFSAPPMVGDRYAISPVPLRVKMWNIPLIEERLGRVLLAIDNSPMRRKVGTSIALKTRGVRGMTGNPNSMWKVGFCRNGGELPPEMVEVGVTENSTEQIAYVNTDGVDLEPYVELISAGIELELTGAEVTVMLSESRATV